MPHTRDPVHQWIALLDRAAFLAAARQLTPAQQHRLINLAQRWLNRRRWWHIQDYEFKKVYVIGET